jgi:1-acyl-sn-glycerol-3-phosphate acyltransferase
VSSTDVDWAIGRRTMGWPIRLVARIGTYGRDRVPRTGGLVYAINHMSWIDIPVVGVTSPRNIDFVAKVEAVRFPGIGRYLRWHGTIAVRRGQSDRDAVRQMKQSARDGRVVGLFVEGTRLKLGRPGPAQPGAAMVAIQEGVPVVCGAIYGTLNYKVGNFAPATVAWGEPIRFDDFPRGAKGYRAASKEIEAEIKRLWSWARDIHEAGRPRNATPPRAPEHLRAPVTLP